MTLAMNLWSLTLLPGQQYPTYVRRDFQITNAALGEELRSKDGRSVVKVTHNPISQSMLESDDEWSDDDEDEDVLSEEDDEEMEVEDVKQKKGKKVEKEEEEEEEEEDSEEEDEDDFEDELEETNVLCSLTAGKTEQASLNLTFVRGEVVVFETTGDNVVHLMGNYIQQDEDSDDESDSDFDGEDDYSELYGSDDDLELDSEEEAAVAKITEIPDEPTPKSKKALPVADKKTVAEAKPAQKRKAEELESPAKGDAGLSKAQKKKLAKKAKVEGEKAEEKPAAAAEKPAAKKETKTPQKKTLPSGLIIEDIKIGDGPVAKTGKRLGMRYIGKLTNGKQFDANTSGKPFSFVLGKGEVIRGWDEGLAGMAVGGERRLTIPAPLAYGNQKIPGIPKNSTLKFDVKLVSIN
ncbi:FK506-binding protein 4 [Cryptococcus gattii E566]|uniref:FK506-binding protein n=2 Tax=Cryptococcus gattii TaxID=37769 RepID=E6R443_CRYGW|nr:Fk506-binding protein 39 kDa, putative [Cryptococcus gattii WM276]ADV21846.1 Fk506-binding protein 39 kDa, putative [Cryptococcus gattii WM276]KIR80766.1 FK506-binding protein 4 [Cryptococcus gattii EJB2]KIY35624.1 FK506-binding protein 4 [Cryptococcus gattii E566]